jgi:endonuclease YncB( thermonuclease family)
MKFSALRLLLFATLTLSASLATFADTLIGEAVAVTDGDTIVVYDSHQHRKVRLNGIDAPESDQEFGQASKQMLSDWGLGKQVTVIWSKTDRYDRVLGTVIIGLVDVSLEQLRTGAAWYFRRYEADVPEIERHLYATAEMEAKTRKLGLWSLANPIAPWDWRARKESPVAEQPKTGPAPTPSTRSGASPSSTATRRAYSVSMQRHDTARDSMQANDAQPERSMLAARRELTLQHKQESRVHRPAFLFQL